MAHVPPPRASPALEWLPDAVPSPGRTHLSLQVLQAARDGGSGGGASGAGLKADGRRPASQPHDSDSEEDGEWEPGAVSWKFGGHCTALGSKDGCTARGNCAWCGGRGEPADTRRPLPPQAPVTPLPLCLLLQYGLVDVPHKRSLYHPPARMSGGIGVGGTARNGSPSARPATRPAQQGSPALPPTPSRSAAREGPAPAGGGSSYAHRTSSSASGRRPPQPDPQPRPGSTGFPLAFVSLVPSANDTPQLRLFPGQLRAQSGKRMGGAAAPGALLIQRSDSSSSRASSHGGDHSLVERSDSAAFGSEISFKGDE